MIFSSDAKLISEHLILSKKPEFKTSLELENAFLSSLTRDDSIIFKNFCASNSCNFRIYHLVNFHPYHFAFAEKFCIDNEIKNLVLVYEDISTLRNLMSPASETLRDITKSLISDLSQQNDNPDNPIYFTPESILALSHIPSFTSLLRSSENKSIYCDLCKLTDRVCSSFAKKQFYADIKYEYTQKNNEDVIIDLPFTPLIYVLSSVLAIMYVLSNDRVIHINAHKFAYAGEISLSANTSLTDKFPSFSSNLIDIANAFPSVSLIAQSATLVSLYSKLILSLEVDRDLNTVTVTIGVGSDYQSEPQFKFRDPYSEIDTMVENALNIIDIIK